jgi:hypothetical protein
MNEPDHELARRLAGYLDEGCRNLDPVVAERLLAARKAALSRYQDATVPAWGWATALQTIGRFADSQRAGSAPTLIAAAALVAALIGVAYWQNYGNGQNGQTSELAEVDVGLLTDELPINAYLDRGFDSWLKRSSR